MTQPTPAFSAIQRILRTPAFRWTTGILAFLATWWSLFTPLHIRYRLDTDVYRLGAQRLLDGLDLYAGGFPIRDGITLPFTYPPISALAFIPLTLFTAHGASFAFGVINLAVLTLICWIIARNIAGLSPSDAIWAAVFIAAVMTLFGPVASALNYGQVNLVLLLFVLLDATLIPPRFRGVLTGVATAFKLTPAVFGLWFLLRRDWASIARMGAAAVGMTALGFAVLPQNSWDYWFGALKKTERIGGLEYSSNQSINGELWRLGLRTADGGTWWWLLLVLLALVATLLLMRRLLMAGLPVVALCVNALFGLLASPVSWDHHFVWEAVMLLVLAAYALHGRFRDVPSSVGTAKQRCRKQQAVWWLVGVGVVCLAVTPVNFSPTGHGAEHHWGVVWHLAGNGFLWWTIAAYVVLWWVSPMRKPSAAVGSSLA